jgi:hypothetical protein
MIKNDLKKEYFNRRKTRTYDILQAFLEVHATPQPIHTPQRRISDAYLTSTYHAPKEGEREREMRLLFISEPIEPIEKKGVANAFKGFISGGKLEKGTVIGDYRIDYVEDYEEGVYRYHLIRNK